MPLLTLLISLFFTVAEYDGNAPRQPKSEQSTNDERPNSESPDYIIMDTETP